MRLLFLLGCLAALSIAHDPTKVKRALPNPPKANKKSEVVEGSADFLPPAGKTTSLPDTEIHGSGHPGFSSDDEDDEDIHGSGSPPDVVEGSGAPPRQSQTRPQVTTSTTTTTTTMAPFGVVTSKTTTTTATHAVFHPINKLPDTEITDDDDDSIEQEPQQPPSVVVQEETTTRRPLVTPVVTPKDEDTAMPFSFLKAPGTFAAIVGGLLVAILSAVLLIMFIWHRMRKRDEGSYALDEPKPRAYSQYAYTPATAKEFYA